LRSPERDGHAAPVDLACELKGRTLAIEHTAVEAFPGQIENDVNFARQMSPITDLLQAHVPSNEHWELIIPADAMRDVPPRRLASVQEAVLACVLTAAPSAPAAPWGAIHWPVSLGVENGAPFAFRFRRYQVGPTGGQSLAGAHITRSVGPLEGPRAERMRKVCNDKLPKLQVWSRDGARTVLVLESNDLVITNAESVAAAYLEAEQGRQDAPDEVYFVWALNDLGGSWYLSAVRIDDRDYKDLWRDGDNLREIDSASLDDITSGTRSI
jgi:hypothetical protein